MKAEKERIRKEIVIKRNSLSKEFVEENSILIIKKLAPYIENSENIMIYMDMSNEVKITKLISLYPKKNFYIPKTFSDGTMKINLYNEKELVLHKFGYYESNSNIFYNENILDLIIIPAIAFDKKRNRIGFGKGYYDKFLHNIKNHSKTLVIGVCYDFQLLNFLPSEPHDEKVEFVITEKRTIF